MCVISPCIHSEIFWSTYLLSDVYVCSIALYFYELCRIFTSSKGAFRANSNIFQFFANQNWQNFCAVKILAAVSSNQKTLNKTSPIDSYVNHKLISLQKEKKSLANCYARTGPFSRKIFCVLVDACATRAGFDTCNRRRIYC